MPRILIIVGLVLVMAGVVWALFPRAFAWFGTLPGDLRLQRDGITVFLPLTSTLLLSGVLTLLLNLVAWLLRR